MASRTTVGIIDSRAALQGLGSAGLHAPMEAPRIKIPNKLAEGVDPPPRPDLSLESNHHQKEDDLHSVEAGTTG